MKIDYKPTKKQHQLWKMIHDEETYQVLFGGAAGGGKSFGICSIMTLLCLSKKGIRIGLARKNLTTLKKTTLISLFEVFSHFDLKPDKKVFELGLSIGLYFNYDELPLELKNFKIQFNDGE